jgi:hypothetical protein
LRQHDLQFNELYQASFSVVEVEVEYRQLVRLYGFLSRRAGMTGVTPYRFACGADVAAARATFVGGRR